MNRILQTALLAATCFAPKAHADEEKRVLFEDTYLERGYTAIGVHTANLMGGKQAFVGVLGGWRFDDRLVFGVSAEALASKVDADVVESSRLGVTLIGGFAEYEVRRLELVAFSASLGLGSGDAGYRAPDNASSTALAADASTEKVYYHDAFTVVEPQLTAYLHASHRVDFAFSLGYRKASGLDLEGVGAGGMNGVTTALMMRGNF